MDVSQTLICQKYRLKELLGKGTFGEVYEAEDVQTHHPCAVKLESESSLQPQLLFEAKILKNIQSMPGAPALFWAGSESGRHIMVMQLLGLSLGKLLEQCKGRFSLKTSLMLAEQMLQRLESLHSLDYLHRDVKPDNFAVGPTTPPLIYLFDFGLSKKYRDSVSHHHIPCRENKGLIGTAKFASVNALMGMEQSRRDDLEALMYVVLNFMKGSLPWQAITAETLGEKHRRIAVAKVNQQEEICRDIPIEISALLRYIKALHFEEKPDYDHIRRTFRATLIREQALQTPAVYDWMEPQTPVQTKKLLIKRSSNRHHAIIPSKSREKATNTASCNNSSSSSTSTKQGYTALPFFRPSTRVAIRRLTQTSITPPPPPPDTNRSCILM